MGATHLLFHYQGRGRPIGGGGIVCTLTDSIDGVLVAGNLFTHAADFLGEITVTDNGTLNATRIMFRRQDDANCWMILIDANGNTALYELTTVGGAVLRVNGGAQAVDGSRFVWVADGETITGYVDDVQTWTYGSAVNFQTLAAGKVSTIATNATIQDLKIWPRNCPSADIAKW